MMYCIKLNVMQQTKCTASNMIFMDMMLHMHGNHILHALIYGVQGLLHVQGLQGVQGLQHEQGLQGMPHVLGLQGVQGVQGMQHVQGVLGLQHVQGLQYVNSARCPSSRLMT